MDLLLELGAPVEYIILTTHAYEHKVFVPSFQRRFPKAQVYFSPKCAPLPAPLASVPLITEPQFQQEPSHWF